MMWILFSLVIDPLERFFCCCLNHFWSSLA